MKNRLLAVILLLVLLVSPIGNARATYSVSPDQPALVYVDLSSSDDLSRFASTKLPMYANLGEGLLTGANRDGQQTLREAGLSIQVLDTNLGSGTYYLAEIQSSRQVSDFALFGQVLLNTANGVLLRMDPFKVDALTLAGAELSKITLTPKTLPTAQSEGGFPHLIEPDPVIQLMIDHVTESQVYTYDRQLAGELPVWVDGGWYSIATRYTNSGTPIQKTTNFVGQHMADLGLNVDYHVWKNNTNSDVIGEIPGLVNPDDIFIIGAHIDDVNGSTGADDNASGSVAILMAADILSQFQWSCTLRFAFWTGEEQGLLGSKAYAQQAHNAGENIIGYLNLDMIAYNSEGTPTSIYLGYNPTMPTTLELANLFVDVVNAYNINLLPVVGTNFGGNSDQASFWQYGYTSILAIEGKDDLNPNYHTSQDTPAHTDPAYFTNYVKASIATYAHMSDCLIASGNGWLDGTVTDAGTGDPLEGVLVIASPGNSGLQAITDPTGYYTMTLTAHTYTITAKLADYYPQPQNADITAGQVSTLDFALHQLRELFLPQINK